MNSKPRQTTPSARQSKGPTYGARKSQRLRNGGGRKDSPGWTEHKRKASRERFHELRPHIQTGVTIWYPSRATSQQLSALNDCNRNFCKKNRLLARSVWEGPGYHQHIALGSAHDAAIERKWRARLDGQWLTAFGEPMAEKAFLWKPQIEPEEIASYLSKTRKNGTMVKGAFKWLTFHPVWETGFRSLFPLKQERSIPRKKRACLVAFDATEKEGGPISPHYTVQTPEKEGDPIRRLCSVCWTRCGRSLWAGSCKCNPAFPNC